MIATLRVTFLLLLLAACAPAVDCIDDTAFTATVISTRAPTLEVQPERGRPLEVLASDETRLISGRGDALTLADLSAGNRLYIRGSLEGRNVTATEVRLLER